MRTEYFHQFLILFCVVLCAVQSSANESLCIGLLGGANEPEYLRAGLLEGVSFALSKGVVTSTALLEEDESIRVVNGVLDVSDNWTIKVELERVEIDVSNGGFELPTVSARGVPFVAFIGPATSGVAQYLVDEITLDCPVVSHVATATGLTVRLSPPVVGSRRDSNLEWFFRATSPDLLRAEALVQWLDEDILIRKSKVVIVHAEEVYSEGVASEVARLLEGTVSAVELVGYSVPGNQLDVVNVERLAVEIVEKGKIDSLVLAGFSRWDSEIIKSLHKKGARGFKTYVIEPSIDVENGIFVGPEFDGVRAISDQPLWNGDYNARRFLTKLIEYRKEVGSDNASDEDAPTHIAYAYDASLMTLHALRDACRNVGEDSWNGSSLAQKRESVKEHLIRDVPVGRVMSDSPLTKKHEVAVKLQRTVMNDNKLWIVTPQPANWSYRACASLYLGAIMSVLLQLLISYKSLISNIIARKDDESRQEGKFHALHVLYSIVLGLLGASITYVFWGRAFIMDLLPKFASTLETNDLADTSVVGFVGAFLPGAIGTYFFRK